MKISFCTTCMGRTEHLQKTLIKNIRDNLPKEGEDLKVEFVLVDYNSQDGLKEWIEDSEDSEELQKYIKDGILVYRQYPEAKIFHHSHAKNMAHRVAAENADPAETDHVVCNLDADNFLGEGFARYLADEFADGKRAIVHAAYGAHKDLPDGYWGRIALRLEDFLALGGYSETRFKKGWGGEDSNFIIRALAYGLEPGPIFDQEFLQVIAHTHEERVVNTERGTTEQDIVKAYSDATTFKELRTLFGNYALSVQANRDGKFGKFGMGTVLTLDGAEQRLGAIKPFRRIRKLGVLALGPIAKDRKMKDTKQTVGVKSKLTA